MIAPLTLGRVCDVRRLLQAGRTAEARNLVASTAVAWHLHLQSDELAAVETTIRPAPGAGTQRKKAA